MEILSRLREEISRQLELVVIDDEPQVLDAIRRVLRRLPVKAQYFSDPIQGRDYLLTHEVAVVLSDNVMPKLKGIDLLGQVAKAKPEVHRILLTGFVEHSEAVAAFNQGAIHQYLTKPWETDELLDTLGRANEQYLEKKLDGRLETIKNLTLKKRARDLSRAQQKVADTETQLRIVNDRFRGEAPQVSAGLKKLSVMIVEPVEGLLRELAEAFEALGMKALTFSDGKQAYTYLSKEDPPEVVLCEWEVPLVSGPALLKAIRKRPGALFQPLTVMLSHHAEKAQIAQAYQAGADGFLLKPFGLNDLLQFLEGVLTKRTDSPAAVHNLKKLRYLILSPNSAQRLWISHFLSNMGAEKFFYATEGKKALPLIESEEVDLIFFDCAMRDASLSQFQTLLASKSLERPLVPYHHTAPSAPPEELLPASASQEDFEAYLQRFVHRHLETPPKAMVDQEAILNKLLGPELSAQMKPQSRSS